jgi:hypothetical protein
MPACCLRESIWFVYCITTPSAADAVVASALKIVIVVLVLTIVVTPAVLNFFTRGWFGQPMHDLFHSLLERLGD